MASKTTVYYVCTNCGAQSTKWYGRCPECGEWNTLQEEQTQRVTVSKKASSHSSSAKTVSLDEVSYDSDIRYSTGIEEFDRVLGGGIVSGSVILLGGEPGAGKSTLLLQICGNVCDTAKVLYVSGEESSSQIKLRAKRLGVDTPNLLIANETDITSVINTVREHHPDLCIIDSIQTMEVDGIPSSAGSVAQVRESASALTKCAKTEDIPFIIVGHVNKDGAIAGPKVMEHIVDAVLQFEGDRNYGFRILRALKNRFGSTAEIGIFEMRGSGLAEVSNPSALLLSHRDEQLSGAAVAATLEGVRPMFVEVQSLVSSAVYGTPQRNANGFDMRRMNMLLAVLEKRCGFKLGAKDVFLNMAGGLRVNDPALDLAVACSILSSNVDIPISPRYCFAAEVGLSGEVRPVSRIDSRVGEAARLGFEKVFISKYDSRNLDRAKAGIEIVAVSVIEEAFRNLFA